MKSLIKINNVKIIEVYKEKNKVICKLENGNVMCAKDAQPIAYCNCGYEYLLSTSNKLLELSNIKEYICKSCSCKGERNPFFGKRHNTSFKKRLSRQRKGCWYIGEKNPMYNKTVYDVWVKKYGKEIADIKQKESNEKNRLANLGEKNHFYGKHHSNESKKKIINSNKNYMENRTESEKQNWINKIKINHIKQKLDNPEYYKQIKTKAEAASTKSQRHYKKNKIEILADEIFHKLNIATEYSFILNGKYQYDFRVTGKKILIEINGDYWHGNPKFFSETIQENKRVLNDTQKKKINHDILKTQYATDSGWKVIRIWEDDIKNNKEEVIKRLQSI